LKGKDGEFTLCEEYWKLVFDEAKPVINLMMNDGFFISTLVGSFDNGLMTMF
jgi:hypothetical protein